MQRAQMVVAARDELVAAVCEWFAGAAREFPWRRPGVSPWGVLVSEVMSQQTQMSRVEPKWREFMQRWPTPAALAAASDADVIRAWERLGYPRRAVQLRRCAETIVVRHGGEVPPREDALLALPGIGPYTAAAVASFAFALPVPVVDTNVRRVLARLVYAQPVAWIPNAARDRAAAAAFVPADGEQARTWNTAVMELGALVCTARSPKCAQCPVAQWCAWRAADYPEAAVLSQSRAAGGSVGAAGAGQDAVARRKPQPRFAGSDRQWRGRIMAVLRAAHSPVPLEQLHGILAAEHPDPVDVVRVAGLVEALIADGLAQRSGDALHLPGVTRPRA